MSIFRIERRKVAALAGLPGSGRDRSGSERAKRLGRDERIHKIPKPNPFSVTDCDDMHEVGGKPLARGLSREFQLPRDYYLVFFRYKFQGIELVNLH